MRFRGPSTGLVYSWKGKPARTADRCRGARRLNAASEGQPSIRYMASGPNVRWSWNPLKKSCGVMVSATASDRTPSVDSLHASTTGTMRSETLPEVPEMSETPAPSRSARSSVSGDQSAPAGSMPRTTTGSPRAQCQRKWRRASRSVNVVDLPDALDSISSVSPLVSTDVTSRRSRARGHHTTPPAPQSLRDSDPTGS